MEFKHIPVLFKETIDGLNIKENGIYVDGTAGGAGHSFAIASKLKEGRLIALDQDPDAVRVATERLKGLNATVVRSNYRDMRSALDTLGIDFVDGVLLDIGVSSYQLDNIDRGFSYHGSAPLDMRMSKEGKSAADLVNTLDLEELAKIFEEYGEEKFSFRIARKIVEVRRDKPILTTEQLSDIISGCMPAAARRDGNPSRRCFQALRIAVNDELGALEEGITAAFECLKPQGRLAIITFHSLEDRITKNRFKNFCTGCTCPPDIPVCVCGKKPVGRLVNRKPITADARELNENPRSRSAKLRIIEKL